LYLTVTNKHDFEEFRGDLLVPKPWLQACAVRMHKTLKQKCIHYRGKNEFRPTRKCLTHFIEKLIDYFGIAVKPVARFQGFRGKNPLSGWQYFCFFHMIKTNFSGHKKISGVTKNLAALPQNASPWLRAWLQPSFRLWWFYI